ncbi:MAG TPA: polysaccharide deacetylase family protein [Longimicrobium sp.]
MLLVGAGSASAQKAEVVRRVAVTVDDLPVEPGGDCVPSCGERITAELLRVFRLHRVPAVGFVNEGKLRRGGRLDPAAVALLRRWVEAGMELGNHTYSHADFHATPLADFQADVLRGEQVTRRVMGAAGRRPRWFRHPFLHTGRDLGVRGRFEAFLGRHGYRVAPVTLDNYDYVFARAYAKAANRGDARARRRIAAEYLGYMERIFAYYEAQSTALFGRNVPHVLLLHANLLNADTFDELARRLERRGYSFVTLDQAVADRAYRSADRYAGPAGITWLHRWALTQGRRGGFFAGEPEVPAWVRQAAER